MSEPFLGEIKLFSYPFAPRGWAFCDGAILSIAQNQALFALLGTTYGGNGQTTFALPDLRGRVPVHVGAGVIEGQSAGEATHTLTVAEMPAHNHIAFANNDENAITLRTPSGNLWAKSSENSYALQNNDLMNPVALSPSGNSQPHNNMQPYAVVNYCIAIQGIFPSRN